jgi:SsrA-binding protein
MSGTPKSGLRKIAANRKALRDYVVLDRIEAGIELRGTEVKALRGGHLNLTAGFADIQDGEAILRDVHIAPYEYGHQFNHEPCRPRRLLLHKREIHRLFGQISQKGRTLIPLSAYFVRGRAKLELGLCVGKRESDKREALRRKEADREAERAMRRREPK